MTNAQKAPDRDQRRHERHKVCLAGKIFVHTTRATLDCTVTNLSAGGAGFWSADPMPLDVPVVLYVDGFGRFEGMITRSVKGEAGILFSCNEAKRKRLEDSLAAFVIDGMKLVTRLRRFERAGSGAPIDHFSLADGVEVACTLGDISLQGALLKTGRRPAIGEIVHLGQTRGWVIRHLDDGIAIQFLQRSAA